MIKQIRKKREKKIKKRKVSIRNASFLMDFFMGSYTFCGMMKKKDEKRQKKKEKTA